MAGEIGLWGVPLAILGGAIRVSTPFIFVRLGERSPNVPAASILASRVLWCLAL